MKVLVVVRRFSEKGGLEQNVVGLVRRIEAGGDSVVVVCQHADEALSEGREIVRVRATAVLGHARKLTTFAAKAAARLETIAHDVSFTSGHAYGVDVARLETGLSEEYEETLDRVNAAQRAVAEIEVAKLASARRILPLSEVTAARVRARTKASVEVVRNGVDLMRFQVPSVEDRAQARSALSLSGVEDRRVVAFIGSGFARKGLLTLIEAMPELDDAVLLVAGEDDQAAAFEARAKDLEVDARWLGYREAEQVLHAADVLCLPSLYDPYGLVALEAMACGRPAVVSSRCGVSEVMDDPRLVVEPRDTGAIADGLRYAFTHRADVARFRTIAERWPLDESFDRIVSILRDVAYTPPR